MEILGAVEGGARSFTDVVGATSLPRSTAHRLLQSMERHGLVTYVGGQGYRLGSRLLSLSATAMRELPCGTSLSRFSNTWHGSPAKRAVVRSGSGSAAVHRGRAVGERARAIVEVGASLPLTAGSAGKVFLAFGRRTETAELLATARTAHQADPHRRAARATARDGSRWDGRRARASESRVSAP